MVKSANKVFLASAVVLVCLGLFLWILSEISQCKSMNFDQSILLWFRLPNDTGLSKGPLWLVDVMRGVTYLGGTVVLSALFALVTVWLYITRQRSSFYRFIALVACSEIVAYSLKVWFGRARPTIVPHLTEVSSPSFPSGHSMMSTVVYLGLAAILTTPAKSRPHTVLIVSGAAALPLLIGTSRIFLGVHYPTDVIGGWLLGLTCVGLAALVQPDKPT